MPSPPSSAAPPLPMSSGCGCLLLLAAVAAGGCDRAAEIRPGDIRTYAIPKAAEPAGRPGPVQAATAATGPSAEAAGSRPPLRYEVPDGWSDAGGSGIRLATLLIGDPADKLEVTVIPASGSLAGNVERWQGQLEPSGDAADLAAKAAAGIAAAETIDVGGTAATMVLLRDAAAAADPSRGQAILGAMIPIDDERSLFVKFKGDAAVADRERRRFAAFVSSIRWKE